MSKVILELCHLEIESLLARNSCGVQSSYEMSQVLLCNPKNKMTCFISNTKEPEYSKIDEDDKIENADIFLQTKLNLKSILFKNKCHFESTYDVSHVYLYDKYGNREKI